MTVSRELSPTFAAVTSGQSINAVLLEALNEIVRATNHEKGLLARQVNAIAYAAIARASSAEPAVDAVPGMPS